jgi:hypothetical protein
LINFVSLLIISFVDDRTVGNSQKPGRIAYKACSIACENDIEV